MRGDLYQPLIGMSPATRDIRFSCLWFNVSIQAYRNRLTVYLSSGNLVPLMDNVNAVLIKQDSQKTTNWFYTRCTHDKSIVRLYGYVPCALFYNSLH